jgi:hypothetical protein
MRRTRRETCRSFPKLDKEGHYHVVCRVEIASPRQVKRLLPNCGPIFERRRGNKKVILSKSVRYYRETCCENREHCTNVGQIGYRRSMISELQNIKEAMGKQCREDGLSLYKVASTLDLVGIKVPMEEEELEKLLGKDAVHITGEGYLALAASTMKMVESRRTLFAEEKRERAWMWRGRRLEDG